MTQPVLILQGGAGRSTQGSRRPLRVRKKILRILNLAYEKLVETNSLEAVTYAVKLLEDDPEFNAGTGSQLQADGKARLSASIMDGSQERFAAVVNLERIKNPVLVAHALLDEEDRVLAGEGAFQFARKLGLKPADPRTAQAIRRWKKQTGKGYDTVGACALDRYGHLASATSTGGRGLERPGRVSDTGMPVANYADEHSAISATGIGEEIIDEGLAIKIATRVRDGLGLKRAFDKSFREIRSRGRRMGAVGVDSRGSVAYATTTEILIFGWKKGKRWAASPS
jgi:L-asparaginase